MPILNYTTLVDAHKTVMEVQRILAAAGARSINIDYDDSREPNGLTFLVNVQNTWINFRLPAKWKGVLKTLDLDPKVPRRYKTEEQARRIACRITKDWVKAQLAIIQAGQAELAEVFLPYAVGASGRTLWQEAKEGRFLLTGGEE